MNKLCTKCNKLLPTTSFCRRKQSKDGFNQRVCTSLRDSIWREENQEAIKQRKKERYDIQKDSLNERRRQKRKTDASIRLKEKKYRKIHHETVKQWQRDYYRRHKKRCNDRCTKRRREIITVRIANNLRSRLSKALKGKHKRSSVVNLVGCSFDELVLHLARLFKPGMNWENYGQGWHVDHIKPCVLFDLNTEQGQRDCFHFSNLQPLWKQDNLSKNKFYQQ